MRSGWEMHTPRPTGRRTRPPHGDRRARGTGIGRWCAADTARDHGYRKINRALWYCPPAKQAPAGSVGRRSAEAVRNCGGSGDDRGRMDSAVSVRCRNGDPTARVWTPRPPPTRTGWNGAAFGMLAVALEALGTDRRALGRNPSGGNGLDGSLAARALGSVRTSRIR